MSQEANACLQRAGYVFVENLFPTDRGTPQGGVISPILANMALDGIESLLAVRFPNIFSCCSCIGAEW